MATGSAVVLALFLIDPVIARGDLAGVPYPVLLGLLLVANIVISLRAPRLKRAAVAAVQRRVLNPVARRAVRRGLPLGWSVLETTGRRTGRPRQVPVGEGREGEIVWIIAEHGLDAGYVRNLQADPRVRVLSRVPGSARMQWRDGIAEVLLEDDPFARQRRLIGWRHPLRALNAATVRVLATDPVTVRVRLLPERSVEPPRLLGDPAGLTPGREAVGAAPVR